MIVVYAEKPDIAIKLAAILGNCIVDGRTLNMQMIHDSKYTQMIMKEREKGYFISNYNNKTYYITWGYGQMCDLKDAQEYDIKYKHWAIEHFPFFPEKYELKLKKDEKIQKQFKVIKKLFNSSDTEYIINSTDYDREGEVIFINVYKQTGCRKLYKRLCINSMTEEEVKNGFNNLKSMDEIKPLIKAAESRLIADWIVGINLTALETIKYRNKTIKGNHYEKIPIGRVITPVLALIVEREKEINEFIPEKYWVIKGNFELPDGYEYKGIIKYDKKDYSKDKEKVENILNDLNERNGQITNFKKNIYKRKPPLLYDLTALQMETNAKYGMSAKETIEVAQQLYQNQYLTYPRTNSRYLPDDQVENIKETIQAIPDYYDMYKDIVLSNLDKNKSNKRIYNTDKIGSHYAIVPTYKKALNNQTDSQAKVYGLVVRSLLKAFMDENIWTKLSLTTTVGNIQFTTKYKYEEQKGWKLAEKKIDGEELEIPNKLLNADDEDDIEDYEEIKKAITVENGNSVKVLSYDLLEKTTKRPARYTEKSLLYSMSTAGKMINNEELRDALKDRGLGTPSTRADIIERLIEYGYVVRENRTLAPTPKGIEVIENLPIEELKSAEITGEWEYKLHQIEKGELTSGKFYNEIKQATINMSEKLKEEKNIDNDGGEKDVEKS